jgi:riboflavin transporter FmnP
LINGFLKWEKSILILSSILAALLTTVGVVLGVFLLPFFLTDPNFNYPEFLEVIKLGAGGWIGFIGIGTAINLISLAVQVIGRRD